MLKFSRFALLSALLAIAATAQADDKAAAIVNGVSIPESRVDMLVKIATQQGQPDSPEMRKDVRERLINLEVISQAAIKNGLDKNPNTAQQLELARQSTLVDAFAQDYAKNHPISDDVLMQEYESMKARVGDKEYKISHILVDSEDEAKKVVAALKKGAKFAKIAKAESKDPGSKNNGGDLGWAVPSNFVQPFAQAVLKLNKGEVSAPVQTQFGWHVIKLEDTRKLPIPTFDELKPRIANGLQQKAIKKAVDELVSKAKIE